MVRKRQSKTFLVYYELTMVLKLCWRLGSAHRNVSTKVIIHDKGVSPTKPFSGIKGATSRFVHLEKLSLNFSSSSFAISVNLRHP